MGEHVMEENNPKIFLESVILMFIFGVIYVAFCGGHYLISPDETRYVGIAWEMYHNNDFITPRLSGSPFLGKPILFYWWDILAYHIFGVNDFASRFFPTLIGAFTSAMAYVYGRIVFSRRMGLLMGFMLAASPMFYGLTNYANMDGEIAGWNACCLFSFLIAVHYLRQDKPAGTWFYLSYFFAALAFLTKGLIGLVFPGMIIFFWVLLLNDWRLLLRIRLITGLILFLVVITPWLYLCEKANPGFLYYFFIFNQFFRFVGSNFNNQHSFFYFWPIVIVATFPFVLYILQGYWHHIRNYRESLKENRDSLFIALWMILVTIFFSIPGGKPLGHIAPALPPAVLLLAMYFNHVWSEQPSKANQISSWCMLVIAFVVGAALLCLPLISNNKHALEAVPYARFMGLEMVVCAILVFLWLKRKTAISNIITTFIVMGILMNMTLVASLKTFNLQYNYPIAQVILPYLQKYPNAKVLMVGQYYYALPMYLDRNIGIVYDWKEIKDSDDADGWPREIYDGVEYIKGHKESKEMLDYAELKQAWNQKDQVVIVVSSISPGERLDQALGGSSVKQIGFNKRRGAYIYINQVNEVTH